MFGALKKINQLLDRKSKIQFSFLLLLLFVKSLLDGFGLGLIVPYLAAVGDSSVIFNHHIFKKINVYTNIENSMQLIIWMSVILICFYILKNFFNLYVMFTQSRLVFTNRAFQGRALFEAYMNAPYSYHLLHNTAELDRNLRFESPKVYAFVQSFLLLTSNVILTISIFLILLLANWQAVLTIGFFILVFSVVFLFFSSKYNKIFGIEVQESQLHVGQTLNEGLSSVIEAKIHHIESFFPKRYFKYMMSNARANWRQITLGTTPTLFFEILSVGTLVGVVILLSIKNIEIVRVLPILGLFTFAFIRLIPSVTSIINNMQNIRFNIPSVDVVHADFQNLERLSKEDGQNHKFDQQSTEFKSLSLEDVNFSFPSNKQANIIKNLSLQVKKGQSIGITGPSGSGKTTLINMILGLLSPDSGRILLNDEKIHTNLSNWRSFIGYVPQSITLIDSSIKENVALGLEGNEINDKRVWTVLNEANLAEFIENLPEQLNTFIGENGMRLSGGQRQRLGLARALYRNPKVLIFDEATSALDAVTEEKITREIMQLTGKRTLIIIAHRVSTIKSCDLIYYLEDGEIINSGSYKDLANINQDFKSLIDYNV